MNNIKNNFLQIGQSYSTKLIVSQQQVNLFAEVSGDNNPIHLDPNYAANTVFKKRIVHGLLSGAIFSKIFGTSFPGEGSIYLEQNLKFLAPIYPDTEYLAAVELVEHFGKHKAKFSTTIKDPNGVTAIDGHAIILNRTKLQG